MQQSEFVLSHKPWPAGDDRRIETLTQEESAAASESVNEAFDRLGSALPEPALARASGRFTCPSPLSADPGAVLCGVGQC
jgi:hypothetical protein